MSKKKVIVTGGAGFIGSHMVDLLISEDYSVIVIDNLWNCSGILVSSNAEIFPSSSGLDVMGTVRMRELKRIWNTFSLMGLSLKRIKSTRFFGFQKSKKYCNSQLSLSVDLNLRI